MSQEDYFEENKGAIAWRAILFFFLFINFN